MQSISEIRAILAARGLRPKRRFGQNFLHDKNQLARLVTAARIVPGEVVLEIGPGTGTLTGALLDAGATVVVCEIDHDLAGVIEELYGERVDLVRGDCLERERRLAAPVVAAIGNRPFKLVANLPYGAASPIMVALLIDHPACRGQYVTIQKEVADRVMATPGGKDYGPLGIIVQALGTARRIATVKPASFWPAPKVTSAMLEIRPNLDHGLDDPAAFARFVTGLFSKRRKQLGSIFGRDLAWPVGVAPDLRPEALTVPQLVELWRTAGTMPA